MKSFLGLHQILFLFLWVAIIILGGQYPQFIRDGFMAITMLFGSIIAGATSEGGGAVAFPVMTLIYKIPPAIARDFSLMIQSFGMVSAAIIIIKRKIPFSKKFLFLCLPGSLMGQFFTFSFLLNSFSPVFIKVTFTSLWLSYALVLFLVKGEKSDVPTKEEGFSKISYLLIFLFSFLGGIVTGLTGSGVDILTFSLATLFLGQSVESATPTSVILMGLSSASACALKYFCFGGLEPQAFQYWLVCAPVVIFGAPFGAVFISKRTGGTIIRFLQASLLIQFIFSWVILPLTSFDKIWSISLVAIGAASYLTLYRFGKGKVYEFNRIP